MPTFPLARGIFKAPFLPAVEKYRLAVTADAGLADLQAFPGQMVRVKRPSLGGVKAG